MQQREALLDYPAHLAEAGAVFGAAAGDDRGDAEVADLGAVLVMVVAAVGVDLRRAAAGPAAFAANRRDRLQQWQELGDVVAVAAGQDDCQR